MAYLISPIIRLITNNAVVIRYACNNAVTHVTFRDERFVEFEEFSGRVELGRLECFLKKVLY